MTPNSMVQTAGLMLLTACTAPMQSSMPESDHQLDGVWQMVTAEVLTPDGQRIPGKAHESLVMFADGYYSMNWAGGAAPAPFSAEILRPTDAEKVARYSTIIVNAGRFETSESVLTIHPDFALVPEYVGGLGRFDYGLRGDTLDLVWHTIESVNGTPDPNTAIGVRFHYQLVRR